MRFIEFEGDISILQEGKVREDKTKPDIEQRDEYSAENFMILSIKNEVKVLTSVKNLASKNLSNFPTTIKEDQELLLRDDTEHNLTFNQRNCIVYRNGEK